MGACLPKEGKSDSMRRLEIGPGENPLGAGWETVDVVPRSGVEVFAKWGTEPLPFADDQFDLVYASHVLEHVPWYLTGDALREAFRVLTPGGQLEVWVPDFSVIVEAYLEQRCVDSWRKYNPDGDYMLSVNGRIFTYGPGPENYHLAVFDESYLSACLCAAGFCEVTRLDAPRGYDHGVINLGVGGTKPA